MSEPGTGFPPTELPAKDSAGLAGYVELVRRNRDFRSLWAGEIVSLLGDWFNLVASASLVNELTGSGLAVGLLFIIRMLAPFLVSPFAGVAADRFNRRRLLVATDILRAITVCGFLLVQTPGQIWLLYGLTAVQLGLSGFFWPAKNALLAEIVSPKELGAANALSSATWSTMLALGAAFGGLVAGLYGPRIAFVIDAATFVASAAFLRQIQYRPVSQPGRIGAAEGWAQYQAGIRYLIREPDILAIVLHKAMAALIITSVLEVSQVKIAQELFPLGPEGRISLGLMYTSTGIGTGLGPLLARRLTGDDPGRLRRALALAYLTSGAGLAIIASLITFPLVLAGAVLRGLGGGVIWVFSTQLLLQRLPNQMRGRVLATDFALFTLMSATGALMAGSAMDAGIGPGALLGAMAVLTPIPALAWTVWLRRQSRSV